MILRVCFTARWKKNTWVSLKSIAKDNLLWSVLSTFILWFSETGQNLPHYVMMCLVYTTWMSCRGVGNDLISVIRARGWRYLLLALIDVEACTLITSSHQFTSLASIQVNIFSFNCYNRLIQYFNRTKKDSFSLYKSLILIDVTNYSLLSVLLTRRCFKTLIY